MGRVLGSMFNRRTRVRPTKTEGTIGVPIYGGYIVTQEKHPSLATPDQRYRTYSDLLANTSIAAAGVRYFLNLIGGTQWQFLPAVEGDTQAQEYADLATQMLTEDPATPWHRVTRRMSMYRFWGFSIQEWTAIKRDDGRMTFADIEPRAQRTIERWDVDDAGKLYGVVQRAPQTRRDIYLPGQRWSTRSTTPSTTAPRDSASSGILPGRPGASSGSSSWRDSDSRWT